MWRRHLEDVGVLFSLVDDLQLFWQYKALEWDKVARQLANFLENEERSGKETVEPLEARLESLLNRNEDYASLRERLTMELTESLACADFLGYTQVDALKALQFPPSLPENALLEAAIAEAEGLSKYAQQANYFWHTLFFLGRTFYAFCLKSIRRKSSDP